MKVTIESIKARIAELEAAMVVAKEQNNAITASRRKARVALENDIKGEIAAIVVPLENGLVLIL